MSSGFAKLDAGIVDSTIWMQPHDVLRVWIAMLAKADHSGYVRASVPAMAHLCMVPIERIEQVIGILTSPDPYSRTPDDEGRRLRAVDGGWEIVNYMAYRSKRAEEDRREYQRQWDRDNRGNRPLSSKRPPDNPRQTPDKPPTASDSIRQIRHNPTHAEAEAEADKIKSKSTEKQPPSAARIVGVCKPILDAYHEALPRCQRVAVLNTKRKRRLAAAAKLARQVCAQQGWPYDGEQFWAAYFGECSADPWMRGEVANPKNPAWRQNIDVLLAEDRFAGVMDRAIEAMRRGAA